MFKKLVSILLILVVMLSGTIVFADVQQGPEVYTITVTEDGGKYQLDYVELNFKKNSMGKDMEPVTFTVKLYTENGTPYIDIEPSVEQFDKDVTIKVQDRDVEMYDIVTGETNTVDLDHYMFKVEHFSRYIIQG